MRPTITASLENGKKLPARKAASSMPQYPYCVKKDII
jgi:hypothetical protein